MVKATCSPTPSTQAVSPSTLHQVISGLPFHLRDELSGFLEILQDKDVGCKVDHVLLSAAKGQAQVVAEMVQSWPHDISWWEEKEGWAGDWSHPVPWLSYGQLSLERAHLWPNTSNPSSDCQCCPLKLGCTLAQSACLVSWLW